MQIRPMAPEDVAAADAAAWSALREQIPVPFNIEEDERADRGRYRIAHLQRTDPGGAWVADDDGEIVGVALALVREGIWGLSLFGVRPDHQSRGVGRRLLDATLGYAEGTRGGIILSTTDPRAMRRYALAGFELRPCVTLAGAVNRRAIPQGLRTRRGSAAGDRDLCDAVSRQVRNAAHGRDLVAMEAAGSTLLIHDEGGWAAVRDGSLVLLAARDEAIATDLLWSALEAAGPGATVHVDFIASGHDWAVKTCLAAGLSLGPEGPIFVRGDVGPLAPYLPSGAYL